MIHTIKQSLAWLRALPGQLLESVREYDNAVRALSAALDERNSLQRQLAAEREEHAKELKEEHHWRMVNHDNCNRLGAELNYANEQLAAALETIDALTRWRRQSDEPCPDCVKSEYVEYSYAPNPGANGASGECFGDSIEEDQYWRHTPESWQALRDSRAEKVGSDG